MNDKSKKNLIVLILGLAGFIVTADNWVISPILPAISKSLNITIANAGLLISAYLIPFGIFQIVMGPLADRYGKKQVVTFSLIMFTVGTALCSLGAGLTSLALYRAITGIFASSVMPISLALIGDVIPMQERQSAVSSFLSLSYLGQGLSMVIGGSIAFAFSWRNVFIIYALFSLIPVLLLIYNNKLLTTEKNPNNEVIKPYIKLISDTKTLFTYIIIILVGMFIIGSFSYIGSFIEKTYHYNYLKIGFIMTVFGIMTIIGGRIGSKIVNTVGQKKVIMSGLFIAALANIILYYLGTNIYMLIIGVALLGLGFIFAHSTLITRVTEFAQKSRGAAMSLVAFSFMGGGGVGTAIGGKIISSYGIVQLFIVYGVALLGTLILSYALIKDIVVTPANLPNSARLN